MKLSWSVLTLVALTAVAVGACSSDTKGGGDAAAGSSASGSAGTSGSAGSAGTTGGGNAGTTGSGGTTGRGGTTGSAGATGAGGAGTQPVGAACVNSGMCSQADGPAVCCLQINTCVLDGQCPGSTNYIPCNDTTMPCTRAGWICCNAGVMSYCTKQSGCLAP